MLQPLECPMKLVNRKELKSVYGIPYSDQHLMRLENLYGTFPKRVKLSAYRGGRVAWIAAEIEAWIEAQAQQRSPS